MPAESEKPPAKPEITPTPEAAKPEAVSLLEARVGKLEESLKVAATKNDKLEVALAARERKDRVEVLLLESKLPGFAVTEKFRADLLEAKDETAIKAAIEDRRSVARGSFHAEPGNAPTAQGDPVATVDAFLESIRKSGR